jgi:hypothetical protein
MKSMHAVLTGDIIGSSKLTPTEHKKTMKIVRSVANVFPEMMVGKVDVFSGDSWQMVLSDCLGSVRVALYLRAILRREKELNVDTRVSLVWGELDPRKVNKRHVSESVGDLFTLSGRRLSELKKEACLSFYYLSKPEFSFALNLSFGLLDALIRKWSWQQSRAISGMLEGQTQKALSEEFNISQPAVNKSLISSGWPELEVFFQQLESAILEEKSENITL